MTRIKFKTVFYGLMEIDANVESKEQIQELRKAIVEVMKVGCYSKQFPAGKITIKTSDEDTTIKAIHEMVKRRM